MKIKFAFVAAAVAMISLASCKKEYDCNCTTAGSDIVVESHKGKDAQDACNSATKPLQFKVCVPK